MKSTMSEILLLLAVLLGLTSAKLFISQQTLVKQEYESFSVTCKDVDNGARLSWRGPKDRPLGEKTNPQAKATMHGNHLIFKKIKKEDAGIYTCRTSTDSAKFELDVTTPLIFVDTPSVVTGKEGTDIVLRCEAKDADTQWVINEKSPKDDTKYKILADALLIKNATVEDAKNNYSCMAISTAAGDMANKPITLIVTHPPRPRFMRQNVIYGYLGGKINLTCEVDAEPPPTFSWFERGKKYKIIGAEIDGPSPRVSVLMLELRDLKSFRDYECEAKNSEGIQDIIFTVLNSSQPNPPLFFDVTNANSSALILTIEKPEPDPENNTALLTTGFLVEYKPIEEHHWKAQSFALTDDNTYILTNLTKNTTYQVRAATTNSAGFSEFTNITEYSTSSAYIFSANLPYLYNILSIVLIFSIDLLHLHI